MKLEQQGGTNGVEPCDICGDVGWPELIATCSKCNVAREHIYCMQNFVRKVCDDWICETCHYENGTISLNMNISRDPGFDAFNDITEHEITPSTHGVQKTSMTIEHASHSLARGGSTSGGNSAEFVTKLNGHMEDPSSNDQTVVNSTNDISPDKHSMMRLSVSRKTDPAWEHFSFKKVGRTNVYTCLHCSNVYRGGGINRMKQHLAGVYGQFTSCKKVPHDVRQKMKKSLKETSRKDKSEEIHEYYGDGEGCEVVDGDPSRTPMRIVTSHNCGKRKALEESSNYFVRGTITSSQSSLKFSIK